MSDPIPADQAGLPPDGPADLLLRLSDAARAAGGSAALATTPTTQDDTDRSLIGRRVVTLYVWAVPLTLGVILVNGLFAHAMTEATSAAADLIKVAVIPIVTLVLGYYFGKSAKP